MSNN